jgi:hypothetical protein
MYFTCLHRTLSCKKALIVANMQRGGYIMHGRDGKLI